MTGQTEKPLNELFRSYRSGIGTMEAVLFAWLQTSSMMFLISSGSTLLSKRHHVKNRLLRPRNRASKPSGETGLVEAGCLLPFSPRQ